MLLIAIQAIDLLVAGAVFGLVLSLWIGLMLVWTSRRSRRMVKLAQRLGSGASDTGGSRRTLHLWHEGQEVSTSVAVAESQMSFRDKLDSNCRRAGLSVSGVTAMIVVLAIAAAAFLMTIVVLGNVVLALGAGVTIVVVARLLLNHAINKREAQFEKQFVNALELASRSLRAGHPLVGAFQLVSEEMDAPVKHVFADICQRHALGADLEGAIRLVSSRTPSNDMKLFATSVAIQMRSGGNLANLMDRLSSVIRDRIRLSRRVRVLTAQTQMSKRILLVLPVLVFVLFSVLNPTYMEPFYTTMAGRLMLGVGVLGMAIGTWMMNRMTQLKY